MKKLQPDMGFQRIRRRLIQRLMALGAIGAGTALTGACTATQSAETANLAQGHDPRIRSILCFGDSNTWGWNPTAQNGLGPTRFPLSVRWTGILQQELGDRYYVIEEGQNGRTTIWDDPTEGYKNGREYLIPCLESHMPIDLVILMLGTNDLKKQFSVSALEIAQGAGELVNLIQSSNAGINSSPPKVLLIAPPRLGRLPRGISDLLQGGEAKSQQWSKHFRQIAEQAECEFLDAATVVVASARDGVHLEASEHEKLGKTLAPLVKEILAA